MPEFVDTLVTWLNTLAAALVAGVPLFGLLAVRPASLSASDRNVSAAPLRRLLIAGVGLTVVSAALAALAQAAPIPGQIDLALMGVLLGQYASTLGGGLIELRLGLALLLGLLAGSLPPPGMGRAGLWWGAALLGLGVLITVSLQRYAPDLSQLLPVALDAARLLGISLWAGGLTGLAAILAGKAITSGEIGLPRALELLCHRFAHELRQSSVAALADEALHLGEILVPRVHDGLALRHLRLTSMVHHHGQPVRIQCFRSRFEIGGTGVVPGGAGALEQRGLDGSIESAPFDDDGGPRFV